MGRLIVTILVLAALAALGLKGWEWAMRPGQFPLMEVRYRGLTVLKEEVVERAMALGKGGNLLLIDLDRLRERVEAVPWVRRVRIERVLPNTLVVTLEERHAVCLARRGERLLLLDQFGEPIKLWDPGDPVLTPVITLPGGGEEGQRSIALMDLLAKTPWLRERVSEAVGFAGGRWTLITRDGIRLLLPPKPEEALELLRRLQEQYTILDRRVRQIDLRVAGKAAVRLEEMTIPPEKPPPGPPVHIQPA